MIFLPFVFYLLPVLVWSLGLSYLFVFFLCLCGKGLAGLFLADCLAVGVIGLRFVLIGLLVVFGCLLIDLVFAKGFS